MGKAKKWKSVKKKFNTYINGTRGIISLFLALVMMPFLSLAVILVESARYQNAKQMVDELLDCVGLSTLAGYDAYLEERFGLLAISQETTPQETYERYLKENISALSNAFTYTKTSVSGEFPLSENNANTGVLNTQLLEFSEIIVLVEALEKGLDIEDLIEKLYEQLGLEELNKIAEATSAVADTASSVLDFTSAVKKMKTEKDAYEAQLGEYKAAAEDFRIKAEELIDALADAKAAITEEDEIDDIYEDEAVKAAAEACETARKTFETEAGEMATAVNNLRSAISAVSSGAKKIAENTSKADDAIDKMSKSSAQEKCTKEVSDWIVEIANEVTHNINLIVDATYDQDMLEQSRQLERQEELLQTVVCGELPGDDATKYYIDINTTAAQIKNDFATVSLTSVNGDKIDDISDKIESLESQEAQMGESEEFDLGSLLDVANELLSVQLFYDPSLNAHVAPGNFYGAMGEISFSDKMTITMIQDVVSSGKKFVEALMSVNVFKMLEHSVTFLFRVAEFLVAAIAWATDMLVNIVRLLVPDENLYNKFLLAAYSVYNMPCRTTYESGKSLSGFEYATLFEAMGGKKNESLPKIVEDINAMLGSPRSGTDSGFKGAETEYLLIGSDNEIANQCAAFFNLYMLRLVLNIPSIMKDPQVQGMAAAATIGGWAVYLAIIIAEPMIDALLLVNEESVYLIKDGVFLTPGGMVKLMELIPNITGLSDAAKGSITDALVKNNGKAVPKGTLSMDYQEHLMVLLFLSPQDELLRRMEDLIQMEAKEHYKEKFDFGLDKAYTHVKATTSGRLNSMFDIKPLTQNGPFTISRTRCIGY